VGSDAARVYLWIRGAVLASFAVLVVLWIDGPKVAGDTPFVLDGTNAFTDCLSRHDFVACGFTHELNVWGLMSPIGDWPLLQHIPDLIATSLGIQGHPDRVRILVVLNVAALVAAVVLAWVVLSRRGQRPWFWGFLLIALSGPFLAYPSITWGETLAAGVLVCFVAAALLQAHPAVVLVAAAAASLTKETAYPFVAATGLLALVLARRQTGRPIRPQVIGGAAGLALGIVLASLFNVVRFGSVLNTNYLQSELHTPGVARKVEYFVALLVSPSGGIVFAWLTASSLLLVACVWPLVLRGKVDRRPALVFVVTVVFLLAGLAAWWTPFGWGAWGPRLTLPWVLPLVLLAVVAYGDLLSSLARKLLARPWRVAVVAVVVIAFALPHVGYMWRPKSMDEFFTDTTGPCAGSFAIGSAQHYACQHDRLWFRRPVLLYGLRGLGTVGGAATAFVVAVALAGSLVLLRKELEDR
jgi:hypothetical protein